MPRGKFLAFDGLDGSGKDTQLGHLRKDFADDGAVFFTYEPGGTDMADHIRRLLLYEQYPSTPLCDFFLFWASRASHVEDMVEPSLKKGYHVLSNRYASSTWAFQICGEEQQKLEPLFRYLHASMPGMIMPDAYFIFDLPAEVAHARMKVRAESTASQEQTRFDLKPIEYHRRVREGFRQFGNIAEASGSRYFIIDANRDEDTIHAEVLEKVREVLGQ